MKNLMTCIRRVNALACSISFALSLQGMSDEKKLEAVTASSQSASNSASSSASATGLSSISIGFTFDNPIDNNGIAQTPIICKRVTKSARQKKRRRQSPHALIQLVKKGLFGSIDSILSTNNVNTTDQLGNTALHYAVLKGAFGLTKKLIDAGANIDLANCDGFSGLDLAVLRAEYFESNLLSSIALFLKAHSKVSTEQDAPKRQENRQSDGLLLPLHSKNTQPTNCTTAAPVIPTAYIYPAHCLLHLQKASGKAACMVLYPGALINGIAYSDFKTPFTSYIAGLGTHHVQTEFAIAHKYLVATVAAVNQALLSRSVSTSYVWNDLLSIVNKYIGITMNDAMSDCNERWGMRADERDDRDLLLELDEIIAGCTKEKSTCVVQ